MEAWFVKLDLLFEFSSMKDAVDEAVPFKWYSGRLADRGS